MSGGANSQHRLQVLALGGEQLNVNGDAENGLVLAQRARWAGLEAEVHRVELGAELPAERPDVVIIGTFGDPAAERVLGQLREWGDTLKRWYADGCFLLAAGAGFDALGAWLSVGGRRVEGLGIVSGHAEELDQRATDDLIVDSPAFGRLVGFENHARVYRRAHGEAPLGAVVRGTGSADGTEGVVAERLIATSLHGPLLAKNPILADHVLSGIFGDSYTTGNTNAQRADAIAAQARGVIIDRLKLNSTQ